MPEHGNPTHVEKDRGKAYTLFRLKREADDLLAVIAEQVERDEGRFYMIFTKI